MPRTPWGRKGRLLVSGLITSIARPTPGPGWPLLDHTWLSGISCGFAPCRFLPTEIKRKVYKYLLWERMKDPEKKMAIKNKIRK